MNGQHSKQRHQTSLGQAGPNSGNITSFQHKSGDEEQQRSTRAKSVQAPEQATPQEIREHNATHLLYRSWCPICVQARGRQNNHPKPHSKPPIIQLDFGEIIATRTSNLGWSWPYISPTRGCSSTMESHSCSSHSQGGVERAHSDTVCTYQNTQGTNQAELRQRHSSETSTHSCLDGSTQCIHHEHVSSSQQWIHRLLQQMEQRAHTHTTSQVCYATNSETVSKTRAKDLQRGLAWQGHDTRRAPHWDLQHDCQSTDNQEADNASQLQSSTTGLYTHRSMEDTSISTAYTYSPNTSYNARSKQSTHITAGCSNKHSSRRQETQLQKAARASDNAPQQTDKHWSGLQQQNNQKAK